MPVMSVTVGHQQVLRRLHGPERLLDLNQHHHYMSTRPRPVVPKLVKQDVEAKHQP